MRSECDKVHKKYFDENGQQRLGTDCLEYIKELAVARCSGLIKGCHLFMRGPVRGDEILPMLLMVDSQDRWMVWKYLYGHFKMSPAAIGKGLGDAYTTGISEDRDECLGMFGKAKPKYIMDEDEYNAYKELPDVIDIYRGGFLDEKESGIYGLSWTTDYEVAEFFNDRHKFTKDGGTVIYHTAISKKDVLAYFLQRDEFEIIADVKDAEILN